MKNLISVIIMIFTSHTFAETKGFDLIGISKIEVNNTSGVVNVTAVDTGKATVIPTKKKFGDHCKMTIDKKGNTLLVEVEKTGIYKKDCEVDFNITAPRSVVLDIDSGSGDLKIKGTRGDLSFGVGSGTVEVDAEVKNLDGKSGSGNISIIGLTSGGSLKTGSGQINLVYKVAPLPGELHINTGSGDAEISLPKTAKVRTSFITGSGELTNELGDSPDSKFKISMMAGSGDLHIKKQ